MLKQPLEDDIRFANKDMDEATKALAASGEAKATAEGDLSVTTKDLVADTSALADLHKDCLGKAQDFEAATQSRTEELKALGEAKKSWQRQLVEPTRPPMGCHKFHSRNVIPWMGLVQVEAIRLIKDIARKQGSSSSAQLATRMDMAMHSGVADPLHRNHEACVRGRDL